MTNRLPLSRFATLCTWAASALLASLLVSQPRPLAAQAITSASRSAEITVFGGYTHLQPDYGPTKDNGFTLGANYIFFPGYWPVAPAVEVRYMSVTGSTDDEHAITGGLALRSRRAFLHQRLTPYIDALFGEGTIVYAHDPFPGYHQDAGTAFGYGAGVDYYIAHDVSLKVDYHYATWNFDKNFQLTPNGFTIGASYRIPFRSRVGSRYSRLDQIPPDRPAPAPRGVPTPAPASQPAAPTDQTAPSAAPADQTIPPATTSAAPVDQAAPTASAAQSSSPTDQNTTPAPTPADTTSSPSASTPAPTTAP